jgi:hypothetical protein
MQGVGEAAWAVWIQRGLWTRSNPVADARSVEKAFVPKLSQLRHLIIE